MKKKQVCLVAIAVMLLLLIVWVIWGNVTVGLTMYTITANNLPEAFDGYRIAHISDLHNSWL